MEGCHAHTCLCFTPIFAGLGHLSALPGQATCALEDKKSEDVDAGPTGGAQGHSNRRRKNRALKPADGRMPIPAAATGPVAAYSSHTDILSFVSISEPTVERQEQGDEEPVLIMCVYSLVWRGVSASSYMCFHFMRFINMRMQYACRLADRLRARRTGWVLSLSFAALPRIADVYIFLAPFIILSCDCECFMRKLLYYLVCVTFHSPGLTRLDFPKWLSCW